MAKKYYWLKLKSDFFTSRAMKKLRKIAGGDTYTVIYLKLQLLSLKDEGLLYYEGVEPTFYEEMALALDEDTDNVRATLIFLENMGLIEQKSNTEFMLTEVPYLIGGESESAERVRKYRERKALIDTQAEKKEPKSNALRQKQHRAKKKCEEKQHIPYIEDYINNKRYNGNYYVVIQRDKYKCAICGSIENLCVHHIDGYSEDMPQNSNANKMITLCRECHSNIHAGGKIDEDTLDAIDYYIDSNEMLPSNGEVTNSNTEIEIEIEKEKEKDIEKSKRENKRKRFTPPTLEEVQAYCLERNNTIDPQHFIDYYTSNGWLVGKNKMKDWKAAVRTWERNGYSKKDNKPINQTAQELDDFYAMANNWANS